MSKKLDPAPATQENALPDEQLARAQYYICYERHLFHRYCILRSSPAYPLLYMDRCYDWQFEPRGSEPLFSRYNGFMELVCRESWAQSRLAVGRLAGEIRRVCMAGSHMAVPVHVVHSDETTYVTEFLIEAIDDDDTVYYTKTNSTQNSFRKPLPFPGLVERIAFTGDGLVAVTEIRPSPTIERILGLGIPEACRAVFSEYGLSWEDGRLFRYVTPVVVGVDGIDRLIDGWERRAEAILSAERVEKNDQFRLNKHLQNRFQPLQHYLRCLLDDAGTGEILGDRLVARARLDYGRMDAALTDILKFGSLLVQRLGARNLDLYLECLRRLRDTVSDYQQTNLDIQRALTG